MAYSRAGGGSNGLDENSGLPRTHLVTDTYLGVPRTVAISSPPPSNTSLQNNFVSNKQNSKSNGATTKKQPRSRNESNVDSGLTILPWEEFIYDPRVLNDMFILERNGVITFDPEEVNVFFHATRMMKPTFGDISEYGKSWVLTVENAMELDQLRHWMTERISVFGVTLVKKEGKFGKSQRAPCLIVFDPKKGNIRDQLYHAFIKSAGAMDQGRKFCIEMNLNGCVESWCSRVTGTQCKAVGAKLIITNGEEKDNMLNAENVICCLVCLPVWAIQTGILQAYRHFNYMDYELDLSAEELRLHGSVGGPERQRHKLFEDNKRRGVFRTKPSEIGGAALDPKRGMDLNPHKYICVKKYDKKDNKTMDETLDEYETTTLQNLLSHIAKSTEENEAKAMMKTRVESLEDSDEPVENLTDDIKATKAPLNSTENTRQKINPPKDWEKSQRRSKKMSSVEKKEETLTKSSWDYTDQKSATVTNECATSNLSENVQSKQYVDLHSQKGVLNKTMRQEDMENDGVKKSSIYGKGMETLLLKGYSRHEDEDSDTSEKVVKVKKTTRKKSHKRNTDQKKHQGVRNQAFTSEAGKQEKTHTWNGSKNNGGIPESESSDDGVKRFQDCSGENDGIVYLSQTAEEDTYQRELCARKKGKSSKSKETISDSEDEFINYLRDANSTILRNIDQERKFTECHYPGPLKESDNVQGAGHVNPKPFLLPEDSSFNGKAFNIIPVDKTDKTCLIDNTDDDLDEINHSGADGDIELTDCELDDDEDDHVEDEKDQSKESKNKRPNTGMDRGKRTSRYDSTRKYLGIRTPRRTKRPMTTDSVQHKAVYEMELM